jgi:hypothetical protein
VDPLTDFHICFDCRQYYNPIGEHGDPMLWLERSLKQEGKLISRQDALRILGDST